MEKDVLLLKQIQDYDLKFCVDETLRMFNFEGDNDIKIKDLTEKEKKIILYLYRGISVGDEQKIFYTCPACDSRNEQVLVFDFNDQKSEFEDILVLDQELTEDNVNDFCTDEYLKKLGVQDFDLLDLDVYECEFERIKKQQGQISFERKLTCPQCSKTSDLDCSDEQFILDHISEESLILIYEGMTILVDSGYSMSDVERMLPFERTILIEQMTQLIEEKRSQDKGVQ